MLNPIELIMKFDRIGLWGIKSQGGYKAMWNKKLDKVRAIVPNFDDPKAVIREYTDEKGELQKIEIFYGGETGGDSKGHGHWVAEKIDDLFQVTLDRNPDNVDGGRHIIEKIHRQDAYNEETRLDRIAAKEAIIAELRSVNPHSPSFRDMMNDFWNRFRDCGSCGHEDNERLKAEFNNVKQDLYEERNRAIIQTKERIISQAESLSYSTDFKSAKTQMKSLQEQWKQSSRASKEDEDRLWNQFKQASDRLYDNAQRDFEERKRKQEDAKIVKESLVRQAESLSYSTDFKNAKAQMKSLQEQWKQSPRTSREDEDRLWSQFKQASDRLYDNAKRDYDERKRNQEETKIIKVSLVRQAESLSYSTDFKNAKAQMKLLQEQWRQLPRASKEDEDFLWSQFKRASDRLYENAQRDFEEHKRKQDEAKIYKEGLVRQAESLSYSTDIKNAKTQMKSLQEQWKQSPRASKEDEDRLWAQFRQASDRLYANAQREYENREREQANAKANKERIISRAENLSYSSDFRSASDEMKRLSDEFYNAGNAGKDNKALKDRFDSAKQRFYSAKKNAMEQKRGEYLQRLQEKINRKREALQRLETAIYNKQDQLSNLLSRPEPGYNNPHRYEIAARRNEKRVTAKICYCRYGDEKKLYNK